MRLSKRNAIMYLQGDLSSESLVQLLYAYLRGVRYAGFQVAGHGDVTRATIEIVLQVGSMFEHRRERERVKPRRDYLKSAQHLSLIVQVVALVIGSKHGIICRERGIAESMPAALQVRPVRVLV
jgi:hypothetical protein